MVCGQVIVILHLRMRFGSILLKVWADSDLEFLSQSRLSLFCLVLVPELPVTVSPYLVLTHPNWPVAFVNFVTYHLLRTHDCWIFLKSIRHKKRNESPKYCHQFYRTALSTESFDCQLDHWLYDFTQSISFLGVCPQKTCEFWRWFQTLVLN